MLIKDKERLQRLFFLSVSLALTVNSLSLLLGETASIIMAEHQYTETRKGKRGLEWNSYFYVYHSRSIKTFSEYWRCSNRQCSGRGKLVDIKDRETGNDKKVFEESKPHSLCFPSAINKNARELLTSVKKRSKSPWKLLDRPWKSAKSYLSTGEHTKDE
jgi:hypothetical protein